MTRGCQVRVLGFSTCRRRDYLLSSPPVCQLSHCRSLGPDHPLGAAQSHPRGRLSGRPSLDALHGALRSRRHASPETMELVQVATAKSPFWLHGNLVDSPPRAGPVAANIAESDTFCLVPLIPHLDAADHDHDRGGWFGLVQ